MKRPPYLSKYLYDWELFEVVLSGRSALDTNSFVAPMESEEQVDNFLKNYGIDPTDSVNRAELFGHFQESLQFVRRFFLKEGNPDEGLDITVPNSLYRITDVGELFRMSTDPQSNYEDRLWAEIVLKIMHTILHVDKDLRSTYFSTIQTQIFDRFYRHIYRNEEGKLFLGSEDDVNSIQLYNIETKAKKTRESVIIKLLHKAENVAEELFDRVGVRIVTRNQIDILSVLKYLLEHNVIIPHNIKPSRSMNTIFDMKNFRVEHRQLIKEAMKEELSEGEFYGRMIEIMKLSQLDMLENERNSHSSSAYKTTQFTCRHLIRFKNPFVSDFLKLRKEAKEDHPDSDLTKKILSLDLSQISRDIRFFYPYEVQIVDYENYKVNNEGEASHDEYKKKQLRSAKLRIFKKLIEYKNLEV